MQGDHGDPGSKGPRGDPGAKGSAGNTGPAGQKGDPKAQGAKGDTGEAGASGAQGTPGAQGSPGAPGASGTPGAPGASGTPGAKGEAGAGGFDFSEQGKARVREKARALRESENPADQRIGRLLEGILDELAPAAGGQLQSLQSAGGRALQAEEPASDSLTLLRYASRSDTPRAEQAGALMGSIFLNQRDIAENRQNIEKNRQDIAGLRDEDYRLRNRSREGTALAIALGGIHFPLDKDRSVSLRFGRFEGEEALALGASFRLRENWQIDFGMGRGLSYRQNGYSAGLSYSR